MITPVPVQDVPVNVKQYDPAAPISDLRTFERHDVLDIVKQFLLREFAKKEVRENERQQILTDVTLYDMQSGHTIYGHNEDTEHFAASVNKLPVTLLVMEELKANRTTLDTVVTWQVSDQRAGNGFYDQPGAPTQATVKELLQDLLQRSGNTAVRSLVNGILGGAAAVNNRLAAKPELVHTRLIPLDSNRFYLGNTTSKEALWVLRQILAEKTDYAEQIRKFLASNIFVNDGTRSQLAGNDFIVLVNKTGLLYDPDGNNVHDVGIIYNTKTNKAYGYSFLTTSPSESPTATIRADESLKNMGRYTLRYSGDTPIRAQQEEGRKVPLSERGQQPETKVLY